MKDRFIKALTKIETFFFSIYIICFPVEALAQSQTTNPSKIGGPIAGAVIAWAICYRARKKPIGGWLLYYYLQLYIGFIYIALTTLAVIEHYTPANWDDSSVYTLYLISTIPTDIGHLAEVVVASLLLAPKFRNKITVNWLRGVFGYLFVFSLLGLSIDISNWPDSVVYDFIGLAWPTIWFFYFTNSRRVNLVFKTNDWNFNNLSSVGGNDSKTTTQENISTITSGEIKKYRKKATIWIVISVAMLILSSILIVNTDSYLNQYLLLLCIAAMAWGMGWYSISKGYNRSLGLLLGILSWIGLIILYVLEDKYKSARQNTGLKLCPSCNAFQDMTKTECPNCGYDLTNVVIEDRKTNLESL